MSKIFETYKSQREIENFVDDLIEKIAQEIFDAIDSTDTVHGIPDIPYSSIDFSKYPEIGKYLEKLNIMKIGYQ
jgi:hypothetical protein